jgi:dihydrofolate synthase/folylpolyglutamate synthase
MVRFLSRLGNPHVGQKIVHIAGTKGKGSTAAMIASALSAAGYRTGLYTSPHLNCVEERLRIDGVPIASNDFIDLIDRVRPFVAELDVAAAKELPVSQGPTYFEILTAMAMVYFADQRVDWAVLEVGLGGRLDSTNVCHPAVSVITSISFDHTKQLGNTLAAIAAEKAGIIKPGVPVVSGVVDSEPRDVVRQAAAQHGCRLIERTVDFDVTHHTGDMQEDAHRAASNGKATDVERLRGASRPCSIVNFISRVTRNECGLQNIELPLLGKHQADNAAVALATLEELRAQGVDLNESDIRRGFATVQWPARVEFVSLVPAVILDTAHNLASVDALIATLEGFSFQQRILIFATTRDKDVRGMLERLLPKFDVVILTRYQNNPRGMPAEELVEIASDLGRQDCLSFSSSIHAWQMARQRANADDLIVITGSFFLAAELGDICRGNESSP